MNAYDLISSFKNDSKNIFEVYDKEGHFILHCNEYGGVDTQGYFKRLQNKEVIFFAMKNKNHMIIY